MPPPGSQANPHRVERRPFARHTASRLLAFACLLVFSGCGDRSPDSKTAGAASAAINTNWPMTRGGPTLSGAVKANLPLHPAIAWTFAASGSITAEAAISDGRIFVGTGKGRMHCLAADSGKERWHFDTKDAITGGPAVSGGRVYVPSNDGSLYALNAGTGAELWRFTIDEKISSGATVIKAPDGGMDWVLVNGYDGITRALNAADGKVIWSYKTDDYINGSPAIVDGRFVVFGGCDARLHVVKLEDGAPIHKIETSAYIPASIATFGTMAYCGNYGNETVAFDVTGGKIGWTYEDRAMPFFSSPGVNDRLVMIGSRDKHLHAIDRRTGSGVWKFATGGRIEGSPIVFEDAVVFGSADGRLYAAGFESGAEIWQLDLGEPLVASPAFGSQLIIVGGEKGTVFAIRGRPASGR